MLVAITALLGGVAPILVPFTFWIFSMPVRMIAGITVLEITRYLALGRP